MATEKSMAILEEIKALTILELADLVKAIEEEFGVSAAPVAVAGESGLYSFFSGSPLSFGSLPKMLLMSYSI